MTDKMRIYNDFRNTPKQAQKIIGGGRLSGFTDINPQYRIERLTEQFGPCGIGWYYETTNKWIQQAGEEILCFVDIHLYIKSGDEWSKPIHGTGGSTMLAKEKGSLRASDECYKMATTDAISVACKQLGIGADIYWAAGETKYNKPAPEDVAPGPPAPEDVAPGPPAPRPENRADRINSLCIHHGIQLDTFGAYLKTLQDEGKVARKTVKTMTDDEFIKSLGLVHDALLNTQEKSA